MEFNGIKGNWKINQNNKFPFDWSIETEEEKVFFGVCHYSTSDKSIGDCLNRDFDNNKKSLSNLELISCAPELLFDLNDVVWLIENRATYEELIERIETSKQLIKKATL